MDNRWAAHDSYQLDLPRDCLPSTDEGIKECVSPTAHSRWQKLYRETCHMETTTRNGTQLACWPCEPGSAALRELTHAAPSSWERLPGALEASVAVVPEDREPGGGEMHTDLMPPGSLRQG